MALDPTEKARRSMGRALANTTQLIQVTDNDPNDLNSSPDDFQIVPDDLFVTDGSNIWTFQRIGINDVAAIRIFRTDLLKNQGLPAKVVKNLKENNSFMNLKPGVAVGLVFLLLERELENA